MAEKLPKTLAELSRVLGTASSPTAASLGAFFSVADPKRLDEIIKRINEIYQTEEERDELYKVIAKKLGEHLDFDNKIGQAVAETLKKEKEIEEEKRKQVAQQKEQLKQQRAIKKQAENYYNVLKNVSGTVLNKILEQNKQIFQTAKDMQLESNLTWKQYSEAYNQAFEATRRINKEVGQSIANARELIETQNFLLQRGFRGIDTADLTNISASVFAITRTLGDFPNELLLTFQQSFRQFGDQTDHFVTAIGNRLNAFSNTFGFSIQMLTQTVSLMTQENAFLYRNNMRAQIQANQNLMAAAALSGAMGLDSAAFISRLASTTQFGTMSEMADLYQGGALLQGFDTSQFQQMMIGGEAGAATEMLFESIGRTINAIDDQYLRAEYMQRIGSSFGLDRSDILAIANNSERLGEIMAEFDQEMAKADTSMVDELGELKMSVTDRLDNWWVNTKTSQNLSKVLQDLGLVGVGGTLKFISAQLTLITGQSLTGGKMAGSIAGKFMGPGGATPTSLANVNWMSNPPTGATALGKLGMAGGGLAIGTAGNLLGRAVQRDTNISNASANIFGGISNIGSGAAAGAMIGSVIPIIGTTVGAGIGALLGGINTYMGAQERKGAMQDLEDQRRQAARNRLQAASQTGDPVVDAINNMNANLTNVLNSNSSESIKMSFVLDTANKTAAGM